MRDKKRSKRGRPKRAGPPGYRVVVLRHKIHLYAKGWRKEHGPTWVIPRSPTAKPRGRPRPGREEQRELMRLRIAVAAYQEQGERLQRAIRSAMILLDWRDQSEAEIERLRSRFR